MLRPRSLDARLDPPVLRPHARVPGLDPGLAGSPRDDRQSRRVLAGLGARSFRRRVAPAERRTRWGGIGLDATRQQGGVVAGRDRGRTRLPRGRFVRRRDARRGLPGDPRRLAHRTVLRGGQERPERRGGRDLPRLRGGADGTTREIASFSNAAGVGNVEPGAGGGLSADGSLLCIWHSEHGDILHASLRVLDVATGASVGELEDEGDPSNPPPGPPSPVSSGWRSRASGATSSGRRSGTWPPASDRRSPSRCLAPSSRCSGGPMGRGSWCVTSSRVGRSCSGSTRPPARARR